MRKLVIGDIHGGYKGLVQALDRASFEKDSDQLIFLGDITDGWSETYELIQFLKKLVNECKHKPIIIKGNHDVMNLTYSRESIKYYYYLQYIHSTVDSYKRNCTPVSYFSQYKSDMSWLDRNSKLYHIDSENRVFVHAGFDTFTIEEEDKHSLYWTREMWKNAMESDQAPFRTGHFYKYNEIFIGHTPTTNFSYTESDLEQPLDIVAIDEDTKEPIYELTKHCSTPMKRCNVWNIDTGAAFAGRVTVMDVDTKEFWQSDNLNYLYSCEMGRNKTKIKMGTYGK